MKIEKINDSQIKCTLSKQDLSDRELHLSELAYGSEKARALFSELLLQASYECGFDAQDMPLMIEAIPMSKDSLVLLLTKVSDPEELNVSYSNISPAPEKPVADKTDSIYTGSRADDVLKESEKVKFFNEKETELKPDMSLDDELRVEGRRVINRILLKDISRAYTFDSIDSLIELAEVVAPIFKGDSVLYKIPENGKYCLFISLGNMNVEDFNKVCNICTEYGTLMHTRLTDPGFYFTEHYETLIKSKALQHFMLPDKH